jgi:hypothetical protein
MLRYSVRSRRPEVGGSKLLYFLWVSLRLDQPKLYPRPCPVGYYNPVLAYGEQKAIQDAREAGANGFIMVDLPPEEAVAFRDKCTTAGYASSPAPYLPCFFIVTQRFLRSSHRTIHLPPENQVLSLDCRQFYLRCFQGPPRSFNDWAYGLMAIIRWEQRAPQPT